MKLLISVLFTTLLFVIPLAVFVAPEKWDSESERRPIAAFPKVPFKPQSRSVKTFFKRLDAFFVDRFPLRSSLLGLSRALHEVSGDSLDATKSFRGKEDWLFLGNSYVNTVDKLQGNMVLSGNELERLTEVYEKYRDAAEKSGAEFYIFIGPNKSSIYPEYLPPVIIPTRQRFISPLLDSLAEAGVKVYDPTDRLIKAKASGSLLYYRTDTHWNPRGAHEAFNGFSEWVKLPALPSFSFSEVPARGGDLVYIGGYKSFPLSGGDRFALHWDVPLSLREEDGSIINAHAASDKTVWVFGDSFTIGLKPYITATFKESRFFEHKAFKTAMSLPHPKPDMILWIVVERRFTHPIRSE